MEVLRRGLWVRGVIDNLEGRVKGGLTPRL